MHAASSPIEAGLLLPRKLTESIFYGSESSLTNRFFR
jgi:hypothetical protein